MKTLILALALILTNIQGAIADDPTTRFDLALKAAGIPIEGVSGTGANCRIDCSTCTKQQMTTAQQMAASFSWAPLPTPQPMAATQAIVDQVTNGTLSAAAAPWATLFAQLASDPVRTKALYAALTANPPPGVTTTDLNNMATAAAAANMPMK